MRSCTVVMPSVPIEIVSLKSATRQLLAKPAEGRASRSATAQKTIFVDRRRQLRLDRDAAGNVSTRMEGSVTKFASELHRHRFTIGGITYFKELPLLKTKHPGNDVGRERLNLGIQIAYDRVVVTARVLNSVFGLVQ